MSSYRIGSMFSGIGGLDLGLERVFGEALAWQVEVDRYCCQMLQERWPDVPNLGDATKVDWASQKPVDIICAGFPCQPASVAGKRKGLDDSRWLWPAVTNALCILRPQLAVLENVPGLLTVDDGRAFGRVLGDLDQLGYAARWTCVRASVFGAPHRRNRLFVLAYHKGQRLQGLWADRERELSTSPEPRLSGGNSEVILPLAYAKHYGSSQAAAKREAGEQFEARRSKRAPAKHHGEPARGHDVLGDSERGGCQEGCPGSGREAGPGPANSSRQLPDARQDAAAGLPGFWASGVAVRGYDSTVRLVEPSIRPLADGLPGRVAQLKALGNAVVPAQAEFMAQIAREVLAND